MGVSPPHLSEIERGVRKPTIRELQAISDYFDVSFDGWLQVFAHPDAETL